MATGVQLLVRRAILATLKDSVGLTALVPAARIYPQDPMDEPVWPFVKMGPPTTRRLRAAGVNGGIVAVDVHAFARARESGGTVAETAEDHAGRIGAAIETALADDRLALSGGSVARIEISDMQLMRDVDDPHGFHYVCQVNARVLAA